MHRSIKLFFLISTYVLFSSAFALNRSEQDFNLLNFLTSTVHSGKPDRSILENLHGITTSDCTGKGSSTLCVIAEGNGVLKVSTNAGKSWTTKSLPNLPQDAVFLATSCTGEGINGVCAVAGMGMGQGVFLVVSRDGGNSWAIKSITGLSEEHKYAALSSVSCTGNGKNAVCVAGGWFALLAVSTDAGETWNVKSLPDAGMPDKENDSMIAMLHSVSCTGFGSTASCAAVGGALSLGGYFTSPIYMSVDGGATWQAKTPFGYPNYRSGYYHSVSCTGSGADAVCTAAGTDYINEGYPSGLFLTVSTNGGRDWSEKHIPGAVDFRTPTLSTSCTGNGPTAVCALTGWELLNAQGPLAVSLDGGVTWNISGTSHNNNLAVFSSISCTGDTNPICVAVGMGPFSLVSVSLDGGHTWQNKIINGSSEPGDVHLNSVACKGNGLAAVCVALGEVIHGDDSPTLLIAISSDGGNTWNIKSPE